MDFFLEAWVKNTICRTQTYVSASKFLKTAIPYLPRTTTISAVWGWNFLHVSFKWTGVGTTPLIFRWDPSLTARTPSCNVRSSQKRMRMSWTNCWEVSPKPLKGGSSFYANNFPLPIRLGMWTRLDVEQRWSCSPRRSVMRAAIPSSLRPHSYSALTFVRRWDEWVCLIVKSLVLVSAGCRNGYLAPSLCSWSLRGSHKWRRDGLHQQRGELHVTIWGALYALHEIRASFTVSCRWLFIWARMNGIDPQSRKITIGLLVLTLIYYSELSFAFYDKQLSALLNAMLNI